MIVDELILKLQADLSDVKKALAKVEADAEKTGKGVGEKLGKAAGTSFADVFQAIAGAALLNSVKGFFSKAAQEFNKFEAAFLRVDSIAKGFGRSVEVARKQVNELANKGFLNLNQAASSYADAIALGFDEKQARKFIDSLSDIAAFQNTIGDGAAAVQSGLAGLLSNSAEKVENIGVPVKVLNMQYNENIKTMGKAAALQKFYAGILKESEKFSGDAARAVDTLAGAQNKANAATDKALVAIGKGLEPTLKKLYNTIEDLSNGFAKWFNSLDSGTKTIVLMIPLVAALTIGLGAMIPILKALSLASPFGWVALGISAVGGLLAMLNEFATAQSPEKIVKGFKEAAAELDDLAEKTRAIESQNVRSLAQNAEMVKSQEALRQKAKELGVDYDTLAKKTRNLADQATYLKDIERQQARFKLDEQRKVLEQRLETSRNLTGFEKFRAGLTFGATEGMVMDMSGNVTFDRNVVKRQLKENDDAAIKLLDLQESVQKDKTAGGGSGKAAPEFRFIKARDELRELQKEYLVYIKKTKDEELKAEALTKFQLQKESLAGELRGSMAQYIEDERTAKMEALDQEKRQAVDNAMQLHNLNLKNIKDASGSKHDKILAEGKARKKLAADLAEIDKADARKKELADLESINRTFQAANATTTGFAQMLKAKDVGGALSGQGSFLTGISGLSSELGPLKEIGGMFGAVGGIVSTISGLFGKSDEERAREAAEQARRDQEALKILELQANYQKSMLALQEAAAKLPFEDLQRQMRLIDIQSQQETLAGGDATTIERQRLARRQDVIQGTLNSQSGEISEGQLFGDVTGTPDSLTKFLSERAAQAVAIQQFVALANSLNQSELGGGFVGAVASQMQSYQGKIPQTLYESVMKQVEELKKIFLQTDAAGNQVGGLNASTVARGVNDRFGIAETANIIGSEIGVDTGIAENLLSTIEQQLDTEKAIKDATEKTAENTAKALELRPDRERSFIDVGRGFIQSLGQRISSPNAVSIAQSLASQNFTVPTEIGSATLTASMSRTLQERMADGIEAQVGLSKDANQLLSGILRATLELYRVMDGNAATVPGFDDAAFTAYLSNSQRRRY